MKHILYKRHYQVCAALMAADCLVFTLINPFQANAVWLIGGYILFGLTLLAVANAVAQVFKGYGEAAHALSRRLFLYGAATVILLIGLQSIGQLTIKDVLTLLPFALILYLYYGYGRKFADNST